MTDDRVSHAPARTSSRPRLLTELLAVTTMAGAVVALLAGPRFVQGAAPARPALHEGGLAVADTTRVLPGQADTLLYQDSLIDPVVVHSVGGVLTATLGVDTATLSVPGATGPTQLNLRSYSLVSTTDRTVPASALNRPGFPGPTFRVKPGDMVLIKLNNNLPVTGPDSSNTRCQPYPAAQGTAPVDTFQDCFHGPNYTNIHYHGMHVTPASIGDDVLLVIPPKGNHQYSFRIPQNQSPGTHWYHPHKHGSVALQVVNGMSGAFIVEGGGLDEVTKKLNMREHLIGIQQIAATVDLMGGSLNQAQPLVNGQYQPVIYMGPGEVQRWRIVNENVTRTTKTFDVGFVDQPGTGEPQLYDVARDGVQFAPVNYDHTNPDDALHMAPGQRLDVFVKAPPSGTHLFQVRHVPGTSRTARGVTAAASGVVVFKVQVDPSRKGYNTQLPQSLPALPWFLNEDLKPASDTAVVVFTDDTMTVVQGKDTLKAKSASNPTRFFLGSGAQPLQKFNDNVVFVPSTARGKPLKMTLGGTQTWKIINNSPQQISHPFHIHINPFQVDSVVYPRGEADPFHKLYEQLNRAADRRNPKRIPIWLDVLPLPQPEVDPVTKKITKPAYAVITQRYDSMKVDSLKACTTCGPQTGYYVMHCHILGHEERGMMQLLQLTAPGQPVTPPPASKGAHPAPHHHVAPGGHGQGQQQGTPRRPRAPVRKDPQQQHHH